MDKGAVEEIASIDFEGKTPEQILEWALERYHPKIALASSFGAEDVVVTDMLVKIRKDVKIFTLDTGRLPQATYDVMQALMDKYGIKFEVYHPKADAVEEMVSKHGPNLFYESIENRKMCCGVRKLEPLSRALKGLDAWITGLRREQAVTRKETPLVEIDESQGGIVKVNPLIEWTHNQVWDYIKRNKVPYNRLHDQNYPSIGCEPCTRAVKPGEDLRAGRWWWERPEQRECGLHLKK